MFYLIKFKILIYLYKYKIKIKYKLYIYDVIDLTAVQLLIQLLNRELITFFI